MNDWMYDWMVNDDRGGLWAKKIEVKYDTSEKEWNQWTVSLKDWFRFLYCSSPHAAYCWFTSSPRFIISLGTFLLDDMNDTHLNHLSLYLIWFKGASIAGHQMRMLLPFRPACCLSCGDQRRWPKWPSPLVFIVSTDKQSPSNEDRCALTAAMVTGHVHEERLIIICNTVNNQIL